MFVKKKVNNKNKFYLNILGISSLLFSFFIGISIAVWNKLEFKNVLSTTFDSKNINTVTFKHQNLNKDSDDLYTKKASFKFFTNNNHDSNWKIYFNQENKKNYSFIETSAGEFISFGIDVSDEYKNNYLFKEIKIINQNSNVDIPVNIIDKEKLIFQLYLPSINEFKNLDMFNNFYSELSIIKFIPSFEKINKPIDKSSFINEFNALKYELKSNEKWSEIKNNLLLFNNKNSNNNEPLNIFLYLNGFELLIDQEDISQDLQIKKNVTLNIFNFNSFISKLASKNGSISVDPKVKKSNLKIEGVIQFAEDVNYNYIISSDGIAFLNLNDNSYIGSYKNIK